MEDFVTLSVSYLTIDQTKIEFIHIPAPRSNAATLVFLHEGLGCVEMWRDFPSQVVAASGCGALIYSRAGYGKSDPVSLPRPTTFMHDEALSTLPGLLAHFDLQKVILFGHSDGGSIALIYAACAENLLLSALILLAPHVFVEDISIKSIEAAARNYEGGPLRSSLEKYHGTNVDCAFWGWNRVWLDPRFRSWNIEHYLPLIKVPVLVIQGEQDEYGTLAQVDAIEKGCAGKVEKAIISDCGHNPQRDQPELTLAAVSSFISRLQQQ